MKPLTALRLVNYVLFQLGWFACVLGAANGMPWLSLTAVAPILALHFYWARRPGAELRLLTVCLLLGLLFDAVLLASGSVAFPNGEWLPGLAPYWMACMWLLLGTTLNLSLHWLRDRVVLAAAFGALGGPLAYLAGEGLGGITLLRPVPALVMLAVGWGLVMPVVARTARTWDGFAKVSPPPFIHSKIDSGGNWKRI